MIDSPDPRWQEALSLHTRLAASFESVVRSLPQEAWSVPVAAEKWSPAHLVEHLTKTYEILLSELDSGPGMRLLTNKPLQWLLRWTMVRKILRGNYFPEVARAPREVRPVAIQQNQEQALELFHQLSNRFHEKIQQTHEMNPNTRLTHSYFGPMNLTDMVVLCSRHIEHHQKQVAGFSTQKIGK